MKGQNLLLKIDLLTLRDLDLLFWLLTTEIEYQIIIDLKVGLARDKILGPSLITTEIIVI